MIGQSNHKDAEQHMRVEGTIKIRNYSETSAMPAVGVIAWESSPKSPSIAEFIAEEHRPVEGPCHHRSHQLLA